MSESLDEGMTGMGDPAGRDAWAREVDELPERDPEFEDRLTDLATQLAELAGLSVLPPVAPEPTVTIKLTCARCDSPAFLVHLRLDPGVTNELYDTHLCNGDAVFPFTLAVRSGA